MDGATYAAIQQRIGFLTRQTDPTIPVAACPGWTVSDIARHLTGVAADVIGGNADGFGQREWTAHQVTSRADQPVLSVLEEWTAVTPRLVAMIDDVDGTDVPETVTTNTGVAPWATVVAAILGDALHHEHDIRAAVRIPAGREDPMVARAGIGQIKMLRRSFRAKDLPTLRVEITDVGEFVDIGREEPVARVGMSAFEAFRVTGGRRTRAEMLALEWSGDASLFVDHLVIPVMEMATTSIGER